MELLLRTRRENSSREKCERCVRKESLSADRRRAARATVAGKRTRPACGIIRSGTRWKSRLCPAVQAIRARQQCCTLPLGGDFILSTVETVQLRISCRYGRSLCSRGWNPLGNAVTFRQYGMLRNPFSRRLALPVLARCPSEGAPARAGTPSHRPALRRTIRSRTWVRFAFRRALKHPHNARLCPLASLSHAQRDPLSRR